MGAEVEYLIMYKSFSGSVSEKCYTVSFFFFSVSVPSSDCCESSLVAQIVTKVKELGKASGPLLHHPLQRARACSVTDTADLPHVPRSPPLSYECSA